MANPKLSAALAPVLEKAGWNGARTDVPPHLRGFIAYTGAGISIAAPTCAPSWWSLTQEILQGFFGSLPQEWLPKDFDLTGGYKRQPEGVFENFAAVLDTKFFEVFKSLDFGAPNLTHRVIALLAKHGYLRACYTTNFDVYIERALQDAGVEFDRLIDNTEYDNYEVEALFEPGGEKKKFLLCKIHGTVDKPDTIIAVSSAYKTAKGFSGPKGRVLSALMEKFPLLFLGYSGWDFEHGNYAKYWERAGPHLKQIIWNKRPGEVGGPNFEQIFRTCPANNKPLFCEADLPDGMIELLDTSPALRAELALAMSEVVPKDYTEQLRAKRTKFFKEWAESITKAQGVSLVLTEANLFSARFEKNRLDNKKLIKDMAESGYEQKAFDMSAEMTKLAGEMGAGKITMDEYMRQINGLMLEMNMSLCPPEHKQWLKDLVLDNKYPGITDDQMHKFSFLSRMGQLLKKLDREPSLKICMEMFQQEIAVKDKGQEEYTLQLSLNGMLVAIIDADDSLYLPFKKMMEEARDRVLRKELDMTGFTSECQKIIKKSTEAKSGMDIDMDDFLAKQMKFISECPVTPDEEADLGRKNTNLVVSIESFVATVAQIGQLHLAWKLGLTEESKALLMHWTWPDKDTRTIQEKLKAYDLVIRGLFAPVIARVSGHKTMTYPKMLVETAVLMVWINAVQYSGKDSGIKQGDFRRAGKFPTKTPYPELWDFLSPNVLPWLQTAFKEFPTRFIQRLVGAFVHLAEFGDNLELLSQATDVSLTRTDEVVNESTPYDVPISLAAYYENRKEDNVNALRYYTKALDSCKFASPSNHSDIICYRAAYLAYTIDDRRPEVTRAWHALHIISKYNPRFHGVDHMAIHPAQQLSYDLAEKLTSIVGETDVKVAADKALAMKFFVASNSVAVIRS